MTTMGLGLLTRGSLTLRRKTWGREKAGEPWVALGPLGDMVSQSFCHLCNSGLIPTSTPLHLLPPAPASLGSFPAQGCPPSMLCQALGRQWEKMQILSHIPPLPSQAALDLALGPYAFINQWAPSLPFTFTQLPLAEIPVVPFLL